MKIKTNILAASLVVGAFVFGFIGILSADASVTKAMLFHDGEMVRTVAVPAAIPNGGIDPLYMVTNGVTGQLGITAVAPGDADYHGGAWAVYTVTFTGSTTPYLLTSESEVLTAEIFGDVTVTRASDLDNRCPVQP